MGDCTNLQPSDGCPVIGRTFRLRRQVFHCFAAVEHCRAAVVSVAAVIADTADNTADNRGDTVGSIYC